MTWTLAQAKDYLGIPASDTTRDAVVQTVLDQTLASLEAMLGRKLLLARETMRFLHVTSQTILLPRYPVREVFSVTDIFNVSSTFSGLDIHYAVGWVSHCSFVGQRQIEVDYEGGYETLPADLERDMWAAFMTLYENTDAHTGAPATTGNATGLSGSGEISSVTLADFGTIKWDVSPSHFALGQADQLLAWGWLAPWYPTFQRYRAGTAGVGLGVA